MHYISTGHHIWGISINFALVFFSIMTKNKLINGTYPIQEIFLRYLDNIMVRAITGAHVSGLLVYQLPQQEEEKLIVVTLVGKVSGKVLWKRSYI